MGHGAFSMSLTRCGLVGAVLGGLALTAFLGGCGGNAGEIRVGLLGICKPQVPFGSLYDTTLAAAELPLLELGGKPAGPNRTDGVAGVSIGGHPTKLFFGCSDSTADSAVAEARELVENAGVNVLIGPMVGSEGFAVREYAKRMPGVTFVNGTSAAQATTLRDPAPNFFRFNGDGAQMQAGLGAYAYHTLGWRNVVTIGEDYEFPYTELAGFVAEFCSLGGNVAKRIWLPLGTQNLSPYLAQVSLRRVDGFVLTSGLAIPFAKTAGIRGNLAHRMLPVLGIEANALQKLGDRMLGVVAASPTPENSPAPAWTAYTARFAKAFPGLVFGTNFLAVDYYNASKAVLKALLTVHGDLSDGEKRYRAALAKGAFDAPNGHVRLDANRQAITSSYLTQVQRDEQGKRVVRTLKTVENVEQTFAGYFNAKTPLPGRTNPPCARRNPPPWAR
jgi:branched-chain amino acid transport system substrate-binding protein